MTKARRTSAEGEGLRQRAEARLRQELEHIEAMSPDEVHRVVYELRTHEIELEVQNAELRDTQEELVESRDRYSKLYNSAPVGYVTLRADGRIKDANLTAAEMLGFEQTTLCGKAFSQFVDSGSQDTLYHHCKRVIATQTVDECELRLAGDAAAGYVQLRTCPALDEDGKLVALRMILSDITARQRVTDELAGRKEIERALRASEALLRATLESTTDGVLVVDKQSRVTHWNRRMVDMWNLPDDIVATRDDAALLACAADQLVDSETFLAQVEMLYQSQEESLDTIELKNGRVFERSSHALMLEGEIAGRVWVFRDVTTRRQAELRHREMETQLAHAGRISSLGEMVAGIAHELNQPLCAVQTLLEASGNVLATSGSVDVAELREWNTAAAKAVTRAVQIIKRLRRFAQKTVSKRSPCAIGEIVEEAVQLVAAEARRRKVDLRWERSKPLWMVRVDRVEIQQVLVNLFNNAFEAMEVNGSTPKEVVVRAEKVDGFVEISVADSGLGLPDDEYPHLFDAFVSTKPDGMGIGLSIIRTIVEAHGGKVRAETNPAGGAAFLFTLPVCVPREGDAG